MKYDMLLARSDSGGWLLLDPAGGKPREVCTVKEACRSLSLSRRQVYRLLSTGVLASHGKAFGEWLLDSAGVERLSRAPSAAQPIPARLAPLFPEYEVSKLNAGRDRTVVISRVLDRGRLEDIRWLLRRLSKGDVSKFIEQDGSRLLSRRSLRLWSLVFEVVPKALPKWRRADPWREAGL
ncbi:MAG: hypothetical protein WC728_06490 [Elusimicrobiota bacterium]